MENKRPGPKTELDRKAILIALSEFNPMSATLESINIRIQIAGVNLDGLTLEKDLRYLVSKGFAEEDNAALSMAVKHWRITSTGQDYLESQGLA